MSKTVVWAMMQEDGSCGGMFSSEEGAAKHCKKLKDWVQPFVLDKKLLRRLQFNPEAYFPLEGKEKSKKRLRAWAKKTGLKE